MFEYLQKAQLLLNDPAMAIFNRFDLTTYCNIARNQIAVEGECVKAIGTLNTVVSQRIYNFSSITFSGSGYAGALKVNQIIIPVGSGGQWMTPRPFPWFLSYFLGNVVPAIARPTTWAQYGQGANGSLYLEPIPDAIYALSLDTTVAPAALNIDTDPEVIPLPWTDAIPYFIAYMALLAARRPKEANDMYNIFEVFMVRARRGSTSTVLPANYEGMMGAQGAASGITNVGAPMQGGGQQGGGGG